MTICHGFVFGVCRDRACPVSTVAGKITFLVKTGPAMAKCRRHAKVVSAWLQPWGVKMVASQCVSRRMEMKAPWREAFCWSWGLTGG
jgi:hypothetical protein